MKKYDYIILGAGLSGLMMATAMLEDDFFTGKKILLLDKDEKQKNDRTWCFWDTGTSRFLPLASRSWNKIYFGSPRFTSTITLQSYAYYKIGSHDFYAWAFAKISQAQNMDFKKEAVKDFMDKGNHVEVKTEGGTYTAPKLMTSLLPKKRLEAQNRFPVLKQHFTGWEIHTSLPHFDKDIATFMDFNVDQHGNTRFMYVLPTTAQQALVEYTLFSEKTLSAAAYEAAIKEYLAKRQIDDYKIIKKEHGVIPMTAYPFEKHNSKNIIHIGTAGGWTRGSTGYTFSYSAKLSLKLIEHLKSGKPMDAFNINSRFRWYDKLFIEVLYSDNGRGADLFASMFMKNPIGQIFRFLDGESTLTEEIKIILSLPKTPFIKALFK
ncbi:MAG: lycopene cyclase [Cytophagaceae bacterium]|nr:lycopene cyclase [Cytophagaceae bacterium]|tara:strand:+ start:9582 stop:10712 length:1131 start_codon:yes stop_codon:yes gene_type:complete